MNLVEDHESKINGQKEILNKIIKGNTEIKDKIEGLQRDQFELRREDKRLEDLQRELRRENESLKIAQESARSSQKIRDKKQIS